MKKNSILVGRVKNTFLEFESEDSDDCILGNKFGSALPHSDPTSRSSSFSESMSPSSDRMFKFRAKRIPTYNFRNDLNQVEKDEKNEKNTKDEKDEKDEKHEQDYKTNEHKKRLNRPGQKVRHEFQAYVEQLKTQLEHDPEHFCFRKDEHRHRLIRDERDIEKVAGILENHRALILAQYPRTGCSSNSTHPMVPCDAKDLSQSCKYSL